MKKVFLALTAMFMAAPAMADVNTICTGGGTRGNDVRIEITHILSDIGSTSEKATINGHSVKSTFEGQQGDVMHFALEGTAHVFSLVYNQLDATAVFTAQGTNLKLFCSRQ